MSAAEAHAFLSNKIPATTIEIEDTESSYDCFDVGEIPALKALTTKRNPDIKYVHLEKLVADGRSVYNLMFFSADKSHVNGGELTYNKLYWDDEDVVEG